MKYKIAIITTVGKYPSEIQDYGSKEAYQESIRLLKSSLVSDEPYMIWEDENNYHYIFDREHVIGFEIIPLGD